jgi:SagB-type dehydrogenase family enzyme
MRFFATPKQLSRNIAEEYHISTQASGATKRMFTTHEVHYLPEIQKLAAEAPLHLDRRTRVALPIRQRADRMTLDQAIISRRSGRRFGDSSLPAAELASVLFLGNGVRERSGEGLDERFYQRNVPNSGNLGSVEIYPIILNVAAIEPGIYHYDSVAHDLAQLRAGQFRTWLKEMVLFQLEFASAAVALALTSAVGRLQSKYGLRGYRLGLIDVGHVAENIYLAATAFNLQACATAGFVDAELQLALEIDGLDVSPMLVVLLGQDEGIAGDKAND